MIRIFLVLLITFPALALPLKVGDVLLQPLDCWTCRLIEAEEQTIYSHIGVVTSVNPVRVAEALGQVRNVSLEEFSAKTQTDQRIRAIRFKQKSLVEKLQVKDFEDTYYTYFHALSYDSAFRWDNFDGVGEKIYCSELVSKLFLKFLGVPTPLKKMHFIKNREQWMKHFKGNIPDGELGNSPGDFERSDLFEVVGEI
jgi:Permuted papain-like amidase enzyme, YaeF/YiiX, C92 family